MDFTVSLGEEAAARVRDEADSRGIEPERLLAECVERLVFPDRFLVSDASRVFTRQDWDRVETWVTPA